MTPPRTYPGSPVNGNFIEITGEKLDELLILKQQPIDVIPTPFPFWNHACRDFGGGLGLAMGWHVTVGGNTGNGKSVFALNMAHAAVEHGENVGFVSLEMSWEQLSTRYMAIATGEKIDLLEPGPRLDVRAHKRASKAIDDLKERTGGALHCNERQIRHLEDIEDAIRLLFEVYNCRMAIVDYMQLAKVLGVTNLLEAVTAISSGVEGIGNLLKIVTVGLSQFNRETSKDYENPPTPQGLMGGSPLENDSHQVMLINHAKYQRNSITNTATQEFILGKNRHGPAGPIDCVWDYSTLRIREVAPVYNSLVVPERGEAWEPELKAI
jgi:replicative DNA helicase